MGFWVFSSFFIYRMGGGVNNEREGRKSEEREKEVRQRQRSLP